jgi:hypothetical protein
MTDHRLLVVDTGRQPQRNESTGVRDALLAKLWQGTPESSIRARPPI